MEDAFRQLQFNRRFLTAFRTGLARVLRWHLMEMFAIALCQPVTPVKEHSPRRIRNRLGEVSVFDHVAWLQVLGDDRVKAVVVKKFVGGFGDKIKTLTSNNICLFCQSVFCLIPPLAPIRLTTEILLKFREFAFGLSIKARIRYLLTFRSRQKVVCADIHTTSGFRNTFQRVRHFANDKDIPTPRRLFQRDLFRVSDEPTVLTDFDFTEFRHFQQVLPSACFTNRILTDTFTCFKLVFSQTPRQRSHRGFVARVSFFLRTLFATALKMLMGCVNSLNCRYLHILGMFGIVRSGSAQVLQMVNLIIKRYRLATIVPHLIPHLEHIVLQLLLMAQLRKKPTFLCFRRIRTVFKGLFHGLSRITPLTPSQWVGNRHGTLRLRCECRFPT